MYDEAVKKIWSIFFGSTPPRKIASFVGGGFGQNVRIEVQNLISDILHYYEINLLLSSTAMKVWYNGMINITEVWMDGWTFIRAVVTPFFAVYPIPSHGS